MYTRSAKNEPTVSSVRPADTQILQQLIRISSDYPNSI